VGSKWRREQGETRDGGRGNESVETLGSVQEKIGKCEGAMLIVNRSISLTL